MGTWFKVVISPYQMKKSKSSLFSSERIKGGLTTRRGAGHKKYKEGEITRYVLIGPFQLPPRRWSTILNHVISRTFSISSTKMDFYNKASSALLQLCVFFVKMLLLSCFLFSNTICLKIVGKISLFNKEKKQ